MDTTAPGTQIPTPRVQTGHLVMTASVRRWLRTREHGPTDIARLLSRHASGDWGDVSAEYAAMNEQAVNSGQLLFSAYDIDGQTFWVITEADRSVTTVLLPEDR